MYEECSARLRMVRVILKDGYLDEVSHPCSVIKYRPEEECIYLLTDNKLSSFSLTLACTGMLLERYWNKSGNVIKFRIQNGFYKNLVN